MQSMPRFPDDSLDVALSDDGNMVRERTGRALEDPSPAPQKQGFFTRMYHAIVGNKVVENQVRRTTQIPRITDESDLPLEYKPKRKLRTYDDLEEENPLLTEDELDEIAYQQSRESRELRKHAFSDDENDTPGLRSSDEDLNSDDDSESEYEEFDAPVRTGGGSAMVLGNVALGTIVIAMALFQS